MPRWLKSGDAQSVFADQTRKGSPLLTRGDGRLRDVAVVFEHHPCDIGRLERSDRLRLEYFEAGAGLIGLSPGQVDMIRVDRVVRREQHRPSDHTLQFA